MSRDELFLSSARKLILLEKHAHCIVLSNVFTPTRKTLDF